MTDKCRICGETTQNTNAKKLFDVEQNVLIHQIELLTGEWLNFQPDLPSYICICCEQDLNVAADFRLRCIQTQKILRHDQIIASASPDDVDPLINMSDLNEQTDNYTRIQKFIEDNGVSTNFEAEDIKSIEIKLDVTDKAQRDEEQQKVMRLPLTPTLSNKVHRKGKKRRINWSMLTDEQAREMKRAQRTRDYVCDQCGRHFTDQSNFKLHLLRHTGVKAYQCKTCNQKFYTTNLLKRHERLHSGIPEYYCQYCNKPFNYSKSKVEHERMHRDERPFECKVCGKRFRTTGKLKDHQVIHTGIRNFHCEICDKSFLLRKTLVAHCKSKFHKSNVQKS